MHCIIYCAPVALHCIAILASHWLFLGCEGNIIIENCIIFRIADFSRITIKCPPGRGMDAVVKCYTYIATPVYTYAVTLALYKRRKHTHDAM